MLTSEIQPPDPKSIRLLEISDVAIMNELSYILKDRIIESFSIDSFTTSDPFKHNKNFRYSTIVDKENPNRIVAIMCIFEDSDKYSLDWKKIDIKRLQEIVISTDQAKELKYELMPKDTNNFYQLRVNGKVIGSIMFAFQICGLHD